MSQKQTSKAVDTSLLRRLYFYLHPYRFWVLTAFFITLLVAYLGPLRPQLIQIAIDDYIAEDNYEGLFNIIGLIFLVLLGESVLLVANTYLMNWIGQNTLYRLRTHVFKKIQSLHVQYFDRNPIGRLVTRATNDIEAIDQLVSTGVVTIIGDVFKIFFIFYFMISMDWKLSLVALSTIPVLMYATMIFKRKVRVAFLEVRDQVARLNSFIQEHINGIHIVQLFNRERKEALKYDGINNDLRKAHIKTIFYFALFWPAVEVLSTTGMALVIWFGGGLALQKAVSLGVLVAFIQYVRQFFLPIRDLSEKFNTLQSALAATERIFGVLDTDSSIIETTSEEKIDEKVIKGNVTFNKVWFRYNTKEDSYILKDVSFETKQGTTTAIVGATGAGKTTIINVLTRFYDIERGEILLDQYPLQSLPLKELRSTIGLVLQDNALLSGSILDNITLGRKDITLDQVAAAAELVEAHRFIEKLPGGYHYVLNERGASLSLGQRQLLCFVRAMVYDPKILILDEATSSVDTETEELVNVALTKLMKNRTSIVIAHRLSTIVHADQILVMHKGEIRERGTHTELLAKSDGLYKKLYELQYKDQFSTQKK